MTGARKYEHITLMLKELHWLPVATQLEVRDILMAFKCIKELAQNPCVISFRQEARCILEILGIKINFVYHLLEQQQVSDLYHIGLFGSGMTFQKV